MLVKPLSLFETGTHDYTHMAVFSANELTQPVANTTQVIAAMNIPTEALIEIMELRLITPFSDPSDAANNSTTVSLGDTALATRFTTAQQINLNGAYITAPVFSAPSNVQGPYAAAQQVLATFSSMAGKTLLALKIGELHVFVKLVNPKPLSDQQLAVARSK